MYITYCDGFDPVKAIFPSPFGKKLVKNARISAHSRKQAVLQGQSACFDSWYYSSSLAFTEVECEEHGRIELVPSGNSRDFEWWYCAGLHPRFSVRRALLEAGQQLGESSLWGFMRNIPGEPLDKAFLRKVNGTEMTFTEVLRKSRTPDQFLAFVRPELFTNFYSRRRRYRVRNWFKEKFRSRSFTIKDFLAERNQELRRLMLRRGVSIQDVLKHLKIVAKDEEGAIYETAEWPNLRYLHVKCPSTGEEYLLSVPSERNGVPLNSPKEARRWTFDVPVDSTFAQEA